MNGRQGWDDEWKSFPATGDLNQATRDIQRSIMGITPGKAPKKIGPAGKQDQARDDGAPTQKIPVIKPKKDAGGGVAVHMSKEARKSIIWGLCAAMALTGGLCGYNGLMKPAMNASRHATALAACSAAYDRSKKASARNRKLRLGADTATNAGLKGAVELSTLLDKQPKGAKPCEQGADTEQLSRIATENGAAAHDTETLNRQIESAAAAVVEARDAKILADVKSALSSRKDEASKLLADSDGKVADQATRDALDKQIGKAGGLSSGKPADYRKESDALGKAMDAVKASMQAKTDADREAADKAAAQAQPAPAPSQGGSRGRGGYTTQPRRQQTPRQRPPAGQQPSRPPVQNQPAPQPSPAPQWSVPPANDGDGGFPNHL